MAQRIRLLAIDLDGTLLNSSKKLSEKNADALRNLSESGVQICLASGRALTSIAPFREQLGIPGPIVSCNGSYVVAENGETVQSLRLSEDVRDQVLSYAKEYDLHTNCYIESNAYCNREGRWADLYRSRIPELPLPVWPNERIASSNPTKLLVIDEPKKIQEHLSRVRAQFADNEAWITISEPEYLEFLPPKVNKGQGVQALASVLNLDQAEVAAIGDYLNDLEMVTWAGFSGAVSNSVEPVKNAAKVLVSSNDEDGVAEFANRVLQLNAQI